MGQLLRRGGGEADQGGGDWWDGGGGDDDDGGMLSASTARPSAFGIRRVPLTAMSAAAMAWRRSLDAHFLRLLPKMEEAGLPPLPPSEPLEGRSSAAGVEAAPARLTSSGH